VLLLADVGRASVDDVALDDGLKHQVDVWIGGGMARIRVDGGRWESVQLKGDWLPSGRLFVGGDGGRAGPGLRGCLHNLWLGRKKIPLTSSSFSSSANVRECAKAPSPAMDAFTSSLLAQTMGDFDEDAHLERLERVKQQRRSG